MSPREAIPADGTLQPGRILPQALSEGPNPAKYSTVCRGASPADARPSCFGWRKDKKRGEIKIKKIEIPLSVSVLTVKKKKDRKNPRLIIFYLLIKRKTTRCRQGGSGVCKGVWWKRRRLKVCIIREGFTSPGCIFWAAASCLGSASPSLLPCRRFGLCGGLGSFVYLPKRPR